MTAMIEGTDYELVPADGTEALNDQAWDVRLTTGSFVETVLRFGNIKFNAEDGCLNFSFMIQSTPDSNIDEQDVGLQEHAGAILESILETAAQEGQLQVGNPEPEE
jgi:hypothetical protein